MLLKGKRLKVAQNDLARKAKTLLTSNFFDIQDFQTMRKRKAIKVLKLISQIEKKKFTRAELHDLYDFIISGLKIKKATSSVVKYFDFVLDFVRDIVEKFDQVISSLCEIFVFRLSMKKVFRI